MNYSAAKILSENRELEKFRKKIIGTKGQFPFDTEDMVSIGEKYLEIYPDSFSDRNFKHVQLGYQIMRICMLEKIIMDFEENIKLIYREIFFKMSTLENNIQKLIKSDGMEKTLETSAIVNKKINEINTEIRMIPVGMTKERFTGGITSFVNIIYLIEQEILKIK